MDQSVFRTGSWLPRWISSSSFWIYIYIYIQNEELEIQRCSHEPVRNTDWSILNEKHICREWESNPRSLDYMSGVLTTAPSQQPCWKQSNQRGDMVAAGLPGFLSFRNRTTSDHPKKIHRLPEIPNYIQNEELEIQRCSHEPVRNTDRSILNEKHICREWESNIYIWLLNKE